MSDTKKYTEPKDTRRGCELIQLPEKIRVFNHMNELKELERK